MSCGQKIHTQGGEQTAPSLKLPDFNHLEPDGINVYTFYSLSQKKNSPAFEKTWNYFLQPTTPPESLINYANMYRDNQVINARVISLLLVRCFRREKKAAETLQKITQDKLISPDLRQRAKLAQFALAYDQDPTLTVPADLLPPPQKLENPVWLLDVDSTLYAKTNPLVEAIRQNILKYASEKTGIPLAEIKPFTMNLYKKYGTTISGLMIEHPEIDNSPYGYIERIHTVPYSATPAEQSEAAEVKKLNGAKYLFTNAYRDHAERVWQTVAQEPCPFGDACDGIDMLPYSKPHPYAYLVAFHNLQIHPSNCVFVDDRADNTTAAEKLGMRSVLVDLQDNVPLNPLTASWKVKNVGELTTLKI